MQYSKLFYSRNDFSVKTQLNSYLARNPEDKVVTMSYVVNSAGAYKERLMVVFERN